MKVFTTDVIFQRQHGSTKFSLSADRKFLLLHSYLYRVIAEDHFYSCFPAREQSFLLFVTGETWRLHNWVVNSQLMGAKAVQVAIRVVRFTWANLGSLGADLPSLGNHPGPAAARRGWTLLAVFLTTHWPPLAPLCPPRLAWPHLQRARLESRCSRLLVVFPWSLLPCLCYLSMHTGLRQIWFQKQLMRNL